MKTKTVNIKNLIKQYFVRPFNLKKQAKQDKNKDNWVDFIIPTRKKKSNVSENIDKVIYNN